MATQGPRARIEELEAGRRARAIGRLEACGLPAGGRALRIAQALVAGMANPRSAQTYAHHLASYLHHCARRGLDPLKVDALEARSYLGTLGSLSAPSVKTRCAVVRAYYDLAIDTAAVRHNPFRRLHGPKVPDEGRTPALTLEEYEGVLRKVRTAVGRAPAGSLERLVAARDYAMLYLMGRMGLRAFQIEALTWDDLAGGGVGLDRLTIVRKGGGTRTYALLPDIAEALSGWRTTLEAAMARPLERDDAIFPAFGAHLEGTRKPLLKALARRTIANVCTDRLADVGLMGRRYAAHLFRATAATIAFENGAELTDVQHLLDHRSPQTTQLYTRRGTERHLAAATWMPKVGMSPGPS